MGEKGARLGPDAIAAAAARQHGKMPYFSLPAAVLEAGAELAARVRSSIAEAHDG